MQIIRVFHGFQEFPCLPFPLTTSNSWLSAFSSRHQSWRESYLKLRHVCSTFRFYSIGLHTTLPVLNSCEMLTISVLHFNCSRWEGESVISAPSIAFLKWKLLIHVKKPQVFGYSTLHLTMHTQLFWSRFMLSEHRLDELHINPWNAANSFLQTSQSDLRGMHD